MVNDTSSGGRRAFRLGPYQRSIAVLIGLGLTAFGVLAVFGSAKELSASVLLILGSLFISVGLLDVLPLRIGVRGWGYDLGAAEAIAEAVGPGDKADRDVERATSLLPPQEREETRTRAAEYLDFERSVIEALTRIAPPDSTLRRDVRTPDGWLADAMVARGKARAYIEVKRLGGAAPQIWNRLARDLSSRAKSSNVQFVLVADRQPPNEALPGAGPVTLVRWRGREDDSSLRNAIENALKQSSAASLHGAIQLVLAEAGRPLTVREIQAEIQTKGLYRDVVSQNQISARVSRYKTIFRRNQDGTISLR